MWTRYNYIKANYPNAEVIFKNGNSGLSLVLSNLRRARMRISVMLKLTLMQAFTAISLSVPTFLHSELSETQAGNFANLIVLAKTNRYA